MTYPHSKDVDYQPTNAVILFRSTWDYIPMPILKLTKYLPMDPFTRMRNVNNLFRKYGKQILREQGPEVDTERKVNSKDVMSILSESHTFSPQRARGRSHTVNVIQSRQTHPRTPKPAWMTKNSSPKWVP